MKAAPKNKPFDPEGSYPKDPTENVRDLMAAAVQRLDDLRIAEAHRIDGLLHLRAEHVIEIAGIRDHYSRQLAEAESKRLDAIRAVDVNARAIDNERAATAQNLLASQTTITA